jgi:hypothetical protein
MTQSESTDPKSRPWRVGNTYSLDQVATHSDASIYRPEILETIEAKIDALSEDLRRLSLDISGAP